MTAASAPGKVILFGEHAVVSGFRALGSAIDLRARVSIKDLPGRLEIVVGNLGLTIKGFSVDVNTGNVSVQASSQEALTSARYITAVLEEFGVRDICARVESDIPLAAGLGSSAAIVVASLGAINQHFGLGLSRDEIASQAYRIEKRVQDGFGSQMDTALATYGGYRLVSTKVEPIDLPEMEIVVGCTGRSHDTRSEVQKVQKIRKNHPDIVDPIFQAIGAISGKAVVLIQEGKLEELGGLMNLNHGLLEAIGVSTRELNELVYAACGAGRALGAKLTGAGGGGCMISLPSAGNSEHLFIAIEQARGKAFCVRTGCQGLKVEE